MLIYDEVEQIETEISGRAVESDAQPPGFRDSGRER